MHRRLTIMGVIAALVTLGAFAAWRLLPGQPADSVRRCYRVETRTLGRSLSERGWLVSLDSTPVAIGTTGDIVAITETGTPVKKGDVVIKLDDTDSRERLEDEEFGLYDAEQELASYKASYQFVEQQEENRLALLGKRYECAQLEEAKAGQGLTPGERRLLDIELEIASLDLEDASAQLERQKRLLAKDFVSELMVEPYERRLATAKANVAEIEARRRLEEKGVPAEELLELRRRVERIRDEIARGEKARERRLDAVRRQLSVSEAHVGRHVHFVAQYREELSQTVTRAPRDGIMSVRLTFSRGGSGWSEYRPGLKRYQHDMLADIVNLGEMKVEFMIHEADIDELRPGMPVHVRLPAYPGRTFEGELREVGGVGRDRVDVAPMGYETGHSGVTMFNASASVRAADADLRPGMSAMVELELASETPRLVLPRAAVGERDGSFYVRRETGRGVTEQRVEGRVLDALYFEVQGGLEEGDTVVGVGEEGDQL